MENEKRIDALQMELWLDAGEDFDYVCDHKYDEDVKELCNFYKEK